MPLPPGLETADNGTVIKWSSAAGSMSGHAILLFIVNQAPAIGVHVLANPFAMMPSFPTPD
jgi:hypothetical protein